MWSFIAQIEPQGFLAARKDGQVVGYAVYVSSLKRMQREAIFRGAILRWALAALAGGFALRLMAIPRILINKIFFVSGAARYRRRGDAQLLNIAVEPHNQGMGVASALVRAGLETMRSLGVDEVRLEVRPWNGRALALYKKTGWREVGRTRDLEGEWVVMVANPSAGP
jgi:[ribosomal protein S18]-alanine N-acetyltransferase